VIRGKGTDPARLYVEVEWVPPKNGGEPRGRSGVIRAEGEVDLDTVARLRDSLDPNLWPECEGVLVDLRKVSFMDSTGIAALVAATRELAQAGAKLAVTAAPRSQVEGLLELTGLRERIPATL
jgi:anti-sigma B factor antagonist